MLTYVYRITGHDHADRDEQGRYSGPEDPVSDHGEVEAVCLRAVAAFAADTGIEQLAVREPQVPSLAYVGVEPAVDGFGLEELFPSGQARFPRRGTGAPRQRAGSWSGSCCVTTVLGADWRRRAGWRSTWGGTTTSTAGERVPLCTAVMTDDDGVLCARWRTESTPSDRDWALRQSEEADQVCAMSTNRE